jgi:hypothetical protein
LSGKAVSEMSDARAREKVKARTGRGVKYIAAHVRQQY